MKTGWVGSLGWKVGFFSLLTVVNLVQGGVIALYEFTGGQTASTDPHASSSATPLNYVGFVSSGISYGTGGERR